MYLSRMLGGESQFPVLDIRLNFSEVGGRGEYAAAIGRFRKLDFRPIVGIQVVIAGIKCIPEIGVCLRRIAGDFVDFGCGGIGFRV